MLTRFLLALIAGLLTGLVISEGFVVGADLFAPRIQVLAPLAAGNGLDDAAASIVALSWLSGAGAGAAMATAISRQRSAGWLIGLLWLIPTALAATLAGWADWMLVVAALSSLGGAALGTRLAGLVASSD